MPFLRKGFLKAAHRPNHLYRRIDPVPYLGFSLLLLCAFMTAQPMINHVRSIDLAIAPHAKSERAALRADAIRIAIMRDGAIYFRNSHVKIDELPNMIRDATLNGAEKKIYLSVDARARYRDVAQVLPQIQLTGVEKVCFLTD